MLKLTNYSSPDGHTYLGCKSCKQEFYVISAARYSKTINFCPYCGDYANRKSRFVEENEDAQDKERQHFKRNRKSYSSAG